ncbi:rhomboid family intramembrane serine protease [Actinotignum urinale]|uniref:Rhomboid family intramembrane serine protease n=1 Tax=Actinotignum urinale TaxID=190146 RepID=A0AAW9HR87_9ACTO|nr:rhomboid family intramembrane serine protease [Actinotignum urinale]MDY5128456.1 rhomboid family intramembrane serine protease [Actinotignum urinale]MDY5155177.1 rhomboid family intramembrane serine protease [Actinotignum urinale]MDY5160537.1 rhomboid family intramembrane serine protease [Actinotignum urinale]WIK59586.1 rhomboid family intramembrane serine protease [Actinotignum urinale]
MSRIKGLNLPVVTTSLIIACVVVFILDYVLPFGLWKYGAFIPALAVSEPYRYLTAMFFHSGEAHILGNMYALFLIGIPMERRLGRSKFLVFYLLCGIGGHTLILAWARLAGDSMWTATLGASGAIFGIFAAYAVDIRKNGGKATLILIVMGYNLVISFIPGLNISWQGHIGGLIAGAIIMALLVLRPVKQSKYKDALQWFFMVASCAVLVTINFLLLMK